MNLIETIKVNTIADDLYTFLSEGKRFPMRVHSVFRTAANLVAPGDVLITMVISPRDIMPMGLTIEAGGSFAWPFRVNDTVEYRGFPFLVMPSQPCRLDFQHAEKWTPYLRKVNLGSAKARHLALTRLKAIVSGRDPVGIASLVGGLDHLDRMRDTHCENVYCRFILPDLTRFLQAVKARDWREAERRAAMLIGFGPGLTPSCDDFMSGVLLSLYYDEDADERERRDRAAFVNRVVAVAKEQTTLVSASMIQHAAKGKAARVYLRVLDALLSGDLKTLESAATQALSVGASSGSDFLFGLCAMQQISESYGAETDHRLIDIKNEKKEYVLKK